MSNQVKPSESVWFFDESRFGTHSKVGHGWFRTGKRTGCNIKLGYQNFYLYSAVNPKTGEEFTLFLPRVNTHGMTIFLRKFQEYLTDKPVLLVMDRAPWHRSAGLIVPSGVRILLQPPYAPELNPVERLWLYIKNQTIKNRIYPTLDHLEEAISQCLKNISTQAIRSICKVNYI